MPTMEGSTSQPSFEQEPHQDFFEFVLERPLTAEEKQSGGYLKTPVESINKTIVRAESYPGEKIGNTRYTYRETQGAILWIPDGKILVITEEK